MKSLKSYLAVTASALSLTLCALGGAGQLGCQSSQDRPGRPPFDVFDWLSWRGSQGSGVCVDRKLPARISLDRESGNWTLDLAGRGTPVIANGRVYALGYEGEGADLQEVLVCLDESTGNKVWERRFSDFVSDVIYSRYSIGSPTVDRDTGNVYCLTTPGLLCCFSPNGELRWQHSMMSEYGRLTFPNGRTGAPLIDGELCIVHVISAAWGKGYGPARDRFYAFDKRTGVSVWSSTPGGPPKDSSFCMPVVDQVGGRRVLYAGLGGGHVVCVDVRTGDPIWRFRMATGGVNSAPLIYKDTIIAIHGKENIDASTIGRMVAIRRAPGREPGTVGSLDITKTHEKWRNDLGAFTSSPVLVRDRVYVTVHTGELCCVDADTGRVLWHEKLAPDQIHASPVWANDKLYVPMNNGSFFIVEPHDEGPKILQKLQLEGTCLAAPAIANGRIYVHTTRKLYSFAGSSTLKNDPEQFPFAIPIKIWSVPPPVGKAVRLQVLPADFVVRPGTDLQFHVRSLDANGQVVEDPVTAAVDFGELPVGVVVDKQGAMRIAAESASAARTLRVAAAGLTGSVRMRIVPRIPYTDDFEDARLTPHPREAGVLSARPRPWWLGAGPKWEIRELDDSLVLAKTLNVPLFQRTMNMIGHPDQRDYTVQVDIRTDGNRRSMSSAGVVNQRYLFVLKGNHQTLEISSNMEVLKRNVPFKWKAETWYRLKTRVDRLPDGSAFVRAKCWRRDAGEPKSWTIEVRHTNAHAQGSPGIYGFTPQSRFRVYLDNLTVTPND